MESGEDEVKPERVFGGEDSGEQVLVGVVEVEFGLDTNYFGIGFFEGDEGFFELKRVGDVFGVVDDEILPFGELQGIIAGFGLGFGDGVRYDNVVYITF